MQYINTTTLEFPVSEHQIRQRFNNISFPTPFEPPAPYAEVQPMPKPDVGPESEAVLRTIATRENNHWVHDWDVMPKNADKQFEERQKMVNDRIAQIKHIRDNKLVTNGFQVVTMVTNTDGQPQPRIKWFHSDAFSRTQQLALFSVGADMPVGIQWKTMDGTFVEMTPALAREIFNTAIAADTAIFTQAETLIAQVSEVANASSVDISAGWPLGYSDAM